jgi:hypothetical protein
VLGAGTLLFLRSHPLPHWDIRGGPRASGPPTRGRGQPPSNYRAGNFDGIDAPWALSALPECLIQQSVFRAIDIAGLQVHIPKGAQRVAAGTELTYRNCTIEVRAKDARVVRGADRFHIPPLSQFYTTNKSLVFIRQTTDGHGAELRIYTASNL